MILVRALSFYFCKLSFGCFFFFFFFLIIKISTFFFRGRSLLFIFLGDYATWFPNLNETQTL